MFLKSENGKFILDPSVLFALTVYVWVWINSVGLLIHLCWIIKYSLILSLTLMHNGLVPCSYFNIMFQVNYVYSELWFWVDVFFVFLEQDLFFRNIIIESNPVFDLVICWLGSKIWSYFCWVFKWQYDIITSYS